ncbi:MAG: AsmA family protein [Terricaulis sp.]
MKFNFKTLGLAAAGLVGVLLLVVVLFIVFFPKELAAREAEKRIEEATGRQLTLGQHVEVSFWPALGFSVDGVSLSNPEGFPTDEPFIAAERLVFAVKVMPLLAGRIEVKELIFDGAALNLEARADGAANWAFPTEQSAPEQEFTIEDLRLDDVRLNHGRIRFNGGDGGEPMLLENVDVRLALQSLDQPAQIVAALDYRGERLEIESAIGLPRAVLEQGETPIAASVRSALLNASVEGAFNATTGAMSGKLEADGRSLRDLLAWIGSPLGEGGGFGAFRVSSQLAHEGPRTALNELSCASTPSMRAET